LSATISIVTWWSDVVAGRPSAVDVAIGLVVAHAVVPLARAFVAANGRDTAGQDG
jgi:hypothetical protein